MAGGCERASEINHGCASVLRRVPVLFGVARRAREEREARAFEALFIERANECRLARCLRKSAGQDALIEQDDIACGEMAVFENLLQLFAAERGGAHDGNAMGIRTPGGHGLGVTGCEAMPHGAHHVHRDAAN